MAKVVDELLVKLGVDPTAWKSGLASAATASNSFVANLKNHQTALAGLTVTSGLTLASQIAFIKDVTNEYAKQEGAVNKLESLLKADQRTRTDSVQILTQQADALQKLTPFADEQIISMQGVAAAFGFTDRQIEQLTPHILDVAAGFRDVDGNALDLETVMKAVGKAVNGNSAGLMKLGIDLGLAKGQHVELGVVIDALTRKFGGAAEAAGTTFSGKMKILGNQVSELKEQIGAALVPTIIDLADKVLPVIQRFGAWASSHKDVVLAIVGGGLAGGGLLAALSALGLILATLGGAAGPIALVVVGLAALVGWFVKLKLASTFTVGDLGLDALNEKIKVTSDYIQHLIEYRNKLTEKGPNAEKLVQTFGNLGGIDGAIDEIDKRLVQARADLNAFTTAKDAALAKVPQGELIAQLDEAKKSLAGVNDEIAKIQKGDISKGFHIGDLDALIAKAQELKNQIADIQAALKITPSTTASRAQFLGGEHVSPTGTAGADEHAAALATARAAAFDNKAKQEWLDAQLSMLATEKAAELDKADSAGKDTVAIEIKYDKAIRDAREQHYAALREMHARQIAQDAANRKTGADKFVGPRTPDQQLGDQVNATAGIKIVPDDKQFRKDWDKIIQISNDALDGMVQGFDDGLTRVDARFAQTGQNAALAVGQIIAGMGDMFAQFLSISGNVSNAIGKTIVISTIEALKTVIRVYGEAEIAKATVGSFLSFGATLAAIGPIAAAMAAGIGVLSAIEGSFQKKNSGGQGYEQGGVVDQTGWAMVHEGEVFHNPRLNTAQQLASRLTQAGAGDQLQQLRGGTGGGNGGMSFRVNQTVYGGMNSKLDMDKAMRELAAKLFRTLGPQGI